MVLIDRKLGIWLLWSKPQWKCWKIQQVEFDSNYSALINNLMPRFGFVSLISLKNIPNHLVHRLVLMKRGSNWWEIRNLITLIKITMKMLENTTSWVDSNYCSIPGKVLEIITILYVLESLGSAWCAMD